jgi:hypothetical protein
MQEYPDVKTIDKWETTIRGKRFTLWINESDHDPSLYVINAGSEGNRYSLVLDKKKPTREESEKRFHNHKGFLEHFSI